MGQVGIEPLGQRIMSPLSASNSQQFAKVNNKSISRLKDLSLLPSLATCCHVLTVSGPPVVLAKCFSCRAIQMMTLW